MPFFAFLSFLLLFWILVLITDFYLRHTNSLRYINFLEEHRISFTPFQVRFYLASFDRHSRLAYTLLKSFDRCVLSSKRSRLLAFWFTLGSLLSLCCFVLTPLYLFRLLVNEIWSVFVHNDQPAQLTTSNDNVHELSLAPIVPPKHSFFYFPVQEHFHSGIMPIFPGLNLPLSHVPIFVSVLILASIVHEFGHAVAAANANVRVTGLGVFLFAIYPGAFTEVEPEQLDRCSYAQKLRIFGAGIWHNIILALVGAFILILIPILSFPFYSNKAGIIVEDVDPKSGLFGPSGLQSGFLIQRINECDVRNMTDWAQCFARIRDKKLQSHFQSGYLAQFNAVSQMTASTGYIQAQPDGEVQCCQEFNVSTSTHICFRYLSPTKNKEATNKSMSHQPTTPKPIFPNFPDFDAEFGVADQHRSNKKRVINLNKLKQEEVHLRKKRANLKMRFFSQTNSPNDAEPNNESNKQGGLGNPDRRLMDQLRPSGQKHYQYSHACLPAMQITEHALCESPATGSEIDDVYLTATLPPGYVCVVPALYNDTALLRFQVKDHPQSVLFIGYLNEPLHMVEVSELTPRFDFIPWWIPRISELFARYLITLSLAMGLLNAMPCYGLDGQFISTTLVEYFCKNCSQSNRKRIADVLMISGTIIFCSNVLIGLTKSLLID